VLYCSRNVLHARIRGVAGSNRLAHNPGHIVSASKMLAGGPWEQDLGHLKNNE